jgi:hypothetical protein
MKTFIRTWSIGFCLILLAGVPALAASQAPATSNAGKSSERPSAYIFLRAPLHSPLFSNCPAEPAGGKSSPKAPPGFVILRAHIGEPRFSDCPVAVVNDKPLTLGEFSNAMASLHEGMSEGSKATRIDYADVLRRLISLRLALEEARAIGLDELPEVKGDVKTFSDRTLRDMLTAAQIKNIKADEAQVEKVYRASIKEIKISAISFKKKSDAEKMEAAAKAGEDFSKLLKQVPKGVDSEIFWGNRYVKESGIEPEIRAVVSGMKVGEISPVVSMARGFAVVKLEDVRHKEDPAAKEEARREVLGKMRFKVLQEFNESLAKKYVRLNQKLFDSLDFEKGGLPGFLALLKDKRVLAQVKGHAPVTVGEYADAVKDAFFHDIEGEIKRKRINKRKIEIYENFMAKKLLLIVAHERGFDKTEQYKDAVKEHLDGVLYSVFMGRVIAPGLKVTNVEMKHYYDEHISEYSSPERIRISSLIFDKNRRSDAEKAVEQLRAGSDFNWVKDNAGGLAGKSVRDQEGELPTDVVLVSTLPQGVGQAVTGSKPGDAKLYENPDGYFYVIEVRYIFPPQAAPFEAVKQEIAKAVFVNKLNSQFQQYVDKLWGAYHVTVYGEDLAEKLEGRNPQK